MDDVSDMPNQKILDFVTAFLAKGTTDQKNKLHEFLEAQSTYRYSAPNSILYREQISVKASLIEELRGLWEQFSGRCKPFHFSNIQVATLCLLSIDTLLEFRQDPSFMGNILVFPQHLLRYLIQGKSSQKGNPGQHVMYDCLRSESERAYHRDQRACVLSKAKCLVMTCFIVPCSITATEANIYTFTDSKFLERLTGDPGVQLRRIMFRESLGALDKSWNMICLHPVLHRWWAECLFGLECLGIVPKDNKHSTVQIKFHWMPKNTVKPHQLTESPYDEVSDTMLHTGPSNIEQEHFPELKSGQIFEIQLVNEDAVKMKAALDLQWVAVRLAAMSGAIRVWKRDGQFYNEIY